MTTTQQLDRTIGARDLMLLVIGLVIGSGIFIVPAAVLRQVDGNVLLALLVWLVAGILSLLGALTYGELGALRPEAGGIYVFLRDAFGDFAAFLFGWTLFLVIAPGTAAALAVAFATYVGVLVPLTPLLAQLVAIAMLVFVTAVNVLGTRESVAVQSGGAVVKTAALLLMSVALLVFSDGVQATSAPLALPPFSWSLLSTMGFATIGVLWAYEGWQWATYAAGEVRDPQRTLPRALALGTAVIIVLYCLAVSAYVAALGPDAAAQSNDIAAAAVRAQFGATAARLVALPILVSIFSATQAIVLTGPRVFFAMARDRLFFRRLGDVHARFGTPAIAVMACGAWAMLLTLTGTFEQLLTYVVFTSWIFYALAGASVFVFRAREPDAPRAFRVPGYPYTPAIFVLAAAAIVINALFTQSIEALIGIAVMLTGVPAYFVWRRASGARSAE